MINANLEKYNIEEKWEGMETWIFKDLGEVDARVICG
jgi:hypothetical protein